MSTHTTPCLNAPTTDGRKLCWELGKPPRTNDGVLSQSQQLHHHRVPKSFHHVFLTDSEASCSSASSATASASSSTERPYRGVVHQTGALFESWQASYRQRREEDGTEKPPAQAAAAAVAGDVGDRPGPNMPDDYHQARFQCRCGGNCQEMPTQLEPRCCADVPLHNTHIKGHETGQCLLKCEEIQQVISAVNCRCRWIDQMRYFGHSGDTLNFRHMTTRNYRYHAYRSFVNYIYGYLGRHIREVVPSCVVLIIRELYPEENGVYVGFKRVDEETGQEIDVDEAEGEEW